MAYNVKHPYTVYWFGRGDIFSNRPLGAYLHITQPLSGNGIFLPIPLWYLTRGLRNLRIWYLGKKLDKRKAA